MKYFPLLFLVVMSLITFNASSHEVRPSYLELTQINATDYNVMWKVPAKNDYRLGLYVKFPRETKNITEPMDLFRHGAYISRWKISHPQGLIESDIKIEGLKSTFTETLVRIERLDGSVQLARLMPEQPMLTVISAPSVFNVALTYTKLGIKHILEGIDHLLFLACLLFIAGTGKRIIITITGFTIAHSLTLILSSLNIVKLAIGPVEAIIALSIVFLALEIVKGKSNTLTWRYPVLVATSFGLLHGFGFANALNEIGLPQSELVTGLLFFNVGVEIGQLIFILAVVLSVKMLSVLNINIQQKTMQQPLAYGIGAIASFWLIERSIGFLT